MRKHVDALVWGFNEHIDYVVEVKGMNGTHYERRGAVRRCEGLLAQLWTNSITPLQSRAQSGPGSPNKAGSRSPLNDRYADLIDTIHEQAREVWATLEDPEAIPGPLPLLLAELAASVDRQCEERPNACKTAAHRAGAWVRSARITLGYETRQVQLTDSVCGRCGGTLIVAADASTDVRCIGTDDEPACGMVYGRAEWLSLALGS
jgi:hypothetical protein